MQEPKFIAFDFFCGAGGTTHGLIAAGGHVVAGIDKDNFCENTYIANNINDDKSRPIYINRDIFPSSPDYAKGEQRQLFTELNKLIKAERNKRPKTPVLFAICAPCQPFTKLSKKQMTSKRNAARAKDSNLLFEALKFVARFKPDIVLSENVPGISDPKFQGIWQEFEHQLKELGYSTGSKIVCASKFGIPQYRKRSILLAVKRKSKKLLELEVPSFDPHAKIKTVRDAISHLPALRAGESHNKIPNHRTRNISGKNYQRISSAKPGENNSYLSNTLFGDLTLECQVKAAQRNKQRCFSDVYTRMSPDRPSPTITTKCISVSNGRFGHFDTAQIRAISLREAAALQSFPDNYIFPNTSMDAAAKMIGNAVPPKLAEYFASYLVDQLRVV